ncbi:MAG: endopeptidase La [Myxococcota bacterium]
MDAMKMNLDIPDRLPSVLPVLPLRQGFLLPGVAAPFGVAREASLAALKESAREHDGWLLLAMQSEPSEKPDPNEFLPIGVLARLLHPLDRPEGSKAVALQGVARVRWVRFTETEPLLRAEFQAVEDVWPDTVEAEALKRALLEAVDSIAEKLQVQVPIQVMARNVENPAVLVDIVAAFVESELPWKHEMLMTLDPLVRARAVLQRANEVSNIIDAQRSIEDKIREDVKGQEREAILRRQLKAIQDELGEGDEGEFAELKKKLEALELSEDARKAVDKELRRLDRIPQGSPERNVAVDWLTWVSDLPWGKRSSTELDIPSVERKLESSHLGLKDVKRQVLENLAVRKLAGSGRADVLLLVGPPGVGKTSIAEAIAEATGRKLVRVALGGVRDESELRGHRRTYIGSRPGRIIEGLRRAEVSDPVVLLDEVDKLGRGWQGDPASALLEILDPEQNHAFTDHYLEVPFDLSKALFIATANDAGEISAPLMDRMEVVELQGYTVREKVQIAREYVLPKLARNVGLDVGSVQVSDEAIEAVINGWTREAGVRQLQRALGKLYRAAALEKATHDGESVVKVDPDDLKTYLGRRKFRDERHEIPERPGVATGLAWTPMGGDVLYVEASDVPGSGQLVLTGQLGDVMKESARAALTYALHNAEDLGVLPDVMSRKDVHVHVPAGATPKDGPSAGITMFTALASLLSGRSVRPRLAMTGEASLRGRVLPVGGIKSKVLAAHAHGVKTVILPKANEPDLEEVPPEVLKELEVVLVEQMSEVLERALEPVPTYTPTFRRPTAVV